MNDLDLTAALEAARRVVLMHKKFGSQEWSIPLYAVRDVVEATVPLIEATVRKHVQRDIDEMVASLPWSLNTPACREVGYTASRIARGVAP